MSLSPLFVQSPHLPWWLDATEAHFGADDLDALGWASVFRELDAQESGERVNVDEDRRVGHTWLRAPETAPDVGLAGAIADTIEAVRDFAAQVRAGTLTNEAGEPFTDLLHIGIGGSQLGPSLVLDALGPAPAVQVHFFDNTDPDGIDRILAGLGDRLRTTMLLVISKSGGTAETMNGLALAQSALAAAGVRPATHLVAITVEGSKLDARAQAEGWLARFPIWTCMGGRFSVTSAVGLLPAELAGLDTAQLLAGARDMDAWTRTPAWRANPAALMAGAWVLADRDERSLVVLPYADRLVLLSRYLQQLVMESLGKKQNRQGEVVEQGLTVYGNKGSTDQHAFVQQLRDGRNDALTLFVQVLGSPAHDPVLHDEVTAGDYLQGFLLGTRRALGESDRPTLTLTVPEVTPYVLGGLIALFERTVGFTATLLNLNAYDQPGVEAGKKAAQSILDLSRAVRAALADGPADLDTLAARTGAAPIEVLYVMHRLVARGAATTSGLTGPFDLPGGPA